MLRYLNNGNICYSHSVMDGDWDWLVDLRVYGMDK